MALIVLICLRVVLIRSIAINFFEEVAGGNGAPILQIILAHVKLYNISKNKLFRFAVNQIS